LSVILSIIFPKKDAPVITQEEKSTEQNKVS
jgi:hypothetical protein